MKTLNSIVLQLAILSLWGCATTVHSSAVRRNDENTIQAQQIVEKPIVGEPINSVASEQYGPPLPSASAPLVPTPPPPQLEQKPQKICVVLGPGMAKAIAEAAVLEALVKVGLPIQCVVGTEMGAVVGALYAAANGSTNSLQWELFKFNKDNYFNFPLFSISDARSSGKKLHEVLEDIFRSKKIEALPLQFGAQATDPLTGAVVALREGSLTDALSASLALPGIFEPWKMADGRSLVSGAVSSPLPIELAESMGGTFLIAVNVIEDTGNATLPKEERFQKAFVPVRNLLRLQKKTVKELIQIHIPKINYNDFSHQGEILAAGLDAAEKEVDRVKAAWDALQQSPSTPVEKH